MQRIARERQHCHDISRHQTPGVLVQHTTTKPKRGACQGPGGEGCGGSQYGLGGATTMPEHDASPVGIKFQRLGGDESCAKTCATS